jgi:hypothetical protein
MVTDRFGAPMPNSGFWSSRASGHPEVVTRNLTFCVSSNQIAAKLLVVAASNVPMD